MFDPGSDAYVVTPSNVANLPTPARFLKVGGTGGNITMTCSRTGASVVIPVAANEYVYLNAHKVFATGTTATPIVAFI
jgi:hypothetical protein